MSQSENPLLDDIDLFSDLLASVGTHLKDRPLSPYEVSNCIVRLQNETGETWEQISSRLSLGKKKTNNFYKKTDTTMVNKFIKLQKLTKKRVYSIGWGEASEDMVGFTSASDISKLTNEEDQIKLFDAILESAQNSSGKKLGKEDVKKIIEEKSKSIQTPIEEIIQSVMGKKFSSESHFLIGLKINNEILKRLQQITDEKNTDLTLVLNESIFPNNSIMKARINDKKTLWLTTNESTFHIFESNWKKEKLSMTAYFNKLFQEGTK